MDVLENAYNYFTKPNIKDELNFYMGDYNAGFIKKDFAQKLFQIDEPNFSILKDRLILNPSLNTFDKRSLFFLELANKLESLSIIKKRNEEILVKTLCGAVHLCKVDRSLIPMFGIKAEGVHINGYTIKDGQKHIWIAKRANVLVEPNKLDNLVGGAIPFGYNAFDTMVKEANEEAGIKRELAIKAHFMNSIHYKVEKMGGIRNDVAHIFALDLPNDFTPTPNDGEVEGFYLYSPKELEEKLEDFESFKFNSWLVAYYFLWDNSLITKNKNKATLKKLFDELTIAI